MCEDVKPLKLLKHDLIHQVSLKVVEVNTQSLLHVAYILQDIPRVGIWSEKLWKRYLGEIFAVIVRIGSSSWLIFWWVMLMVFHAFSVFAPVLGYALLARDSSWCYWLTWQNEGYVENIWRRWDESWSEWLSEVFLNASSFFIHVLGYALLACMSSWCHHITWQI